MDLSMVTRSADGATVIALAGEVDIYTAPRLREELTRTISRGSHHLVVDLSGVEFLDSSGLHALVGALKKVRTYDGSLRLVGARDRVLKIFRITHLTKVFDLEPTMPPVPLRLGAVARP